MPFSATPQNSIMLLFWNNWSRKSEAHSPVKGEIGNEGTSSSTVVFVSGGCKLRMQCGRFQFTGELQGGVVLNMQCNGDRRETVVEDSGLRIPVDNLVALSNLQFMTVQGGLAALLCFSGKKKI
uniref:Uncharacterized protein n=1 Tax=Nelumbo nucifera TaxID=4432 RepID=A0A822YPM2_NELNU|nr:TPA_asm: hypothetical protein HUJ06_004683 [Nelumbo nucifera]